jgi:nucleoside-diphosphate-sugar epimerase/glycosyltransferase A (GT-A) superfamily protein (DUF2064 family)
VAGAAETRPTLVVRVRTPIPGVAKPALVDDLGTHGAAIAQHRLTLVTLAAARAMAARGVPVELHVNGDVDAATHLYPGPWTIPPAGRAAAAGPIIVLGTDCPALTPDHIAAAVEALGSNDAVLGPTPGGGLYLLGLRRSGPGAQIVVEPTDVQAARAAGLRVVELPLLHRVDGPADLPLLPTPYAPARIAITGATGSLGTLFLASLMAQLPELRVTALVRPAPPASRPIAFQRLARRFADRIAFVEHDLSNPEPSPSLRARLAGSDGFWHFGGSTNMHGRDCEAANWRVNDGGTRAVLDLLRSLDAPVPLFHLSTAYVCGERTGTIAEDDDGGPGVRFRNSYEASKSAADRRVRAALAEGLPGCVFRPSVVVEDEAGHGSSKILDLVAAAVMAAGRTGEPLVLRLPPGAGINCVHADWLNAAMSTLAGHLSRGRPSLGRTYHLTARRPLRLADVAAGAAAEQSNWGVVLDPSLAPRDLPPASRLLDRALAPFVPYLTADVRFDRAAFEADAPDLAALPELDPRAVLRHRRRADAVGDAARVDADRAGTDARAV